MKTKTNKKTIKKTMKKTKTKKPNGICGNVIQEKNGWKTLYIYGDAFERGFAHGYLLCDELKQVLKVLPFVVKEFLHTTLKEYLEKSNKIILPIVKKNIEVYDEIRGISAGARHCGTQISVELLVAWNSYMSLYGEFKKGSIEDGSSSTATVGNKPDSPPATVGNKPDSPSATVGNKPDSPSATVGNKPDSPPARCSAFIATGNATKHNDIIIGHTTHTDFITASLCNIVLYIVPTTGYPFVMQISPGYVASVTDWFICSTGIVGCETTISAVNYKPQFGNPFFCRIRKAMQYGTSLDQYVEIMLDDNAGDYACSWQFGNINTNEIMLFELGYETHSIQRTHNGVYYGMNSAVDPQVRLLETTDITHRDIKTSTGARNYRLNHLLNEKYYGKIDIHTAKKILADHYDPYENKIHMNSRSICKHTELDAQHTNRPAFYPFGCTDAKITNTKMARKLSFIGRFGSACGRDFNAAQHIKSHPIFKSWTPFLRDLPTQPYNNFEIDKVI